LNSSEKFNSPYYPRRARWYARIFYFGGAIHRGLTLDRICLPKEITIGGLIGGILIPGLAVYLRGPRLWGKAAMAGCALLSAIFIVWLGYPAANLAFGLMLSIHTTGLVYYCGPGLVNKPFRFRILFTIGTMLVLGSLFYAPLRSTIQHHWLMPLRVGDRVIVVSVRTTPDSLKVGDWAAFRSSAAGGEIRQEGGLVFGPVIGLGGDHVGSVDVPEKHWLIRAEFIRYYRHEGFATWNNATEQMTIVPTIVSREEFVGRPFKRWFFRKQTLP
jgi:hypothetical protein